MRTFVMKIATILAALAVLLVFDGLISGAFPVVFGLALLAACLVAVPRFFRASLRPARAARRHPRHTPPAGSPVRLHATAPKRRTVSGHSRVA
ncbi:MAG: hypothetical protein AB7V55_02685 [Oscillospiraceae bacterium]